MLSIASMISVTRETVPHRGFYCITTGIAMLPNNLIFTMMQATLLEYHEANQNWNGVND